MENTIQYASHIITTVLAVGILINIWWFYNKQKAKLNIEEKKDYGIVLLSIAMLIWALISALRLVTQHATDEVQKQIEFVIKFLSVVNNGLFLAALTYFEHGIEWVNMPERRKRAFLFIGIFSLFMYISIALLFAFDVPIEKGSRILFADLLEFIYSFFVAAILLLVLALSFYHRKLYLISLIVVLSNTLLIAEQLLITLFDKSDDFKMLRAILFQSSYSLMLATFISLGFSWIVEKFTVLPYINEYLPLLRIREIIENNKGKPEQIKTILRDKTTNNELDDSLALLEEWFLMYNEMDNANQARLIRGRWNKLKSDKQKGLLTDEQERIETNKIRSSVNEVIELIICT